MNLFNIFRRIDTGMVIAKNHYPASGGPKETLTSFNKGANEVAVFTASPTPTDGWSLVVKGTDRSGLHLMTKEIYVDSLTWSCAAIGSTYRGA